jgi:hypothetical protein
VRTLNVLNQLTEFYEFVIQEERRKLTMAVTEYYQSTTIGQIAVRTVSGKRRWALRRTTCDTPKRLRDCKAQLVDDAPHGLDSGYEDLCVECNLDQ